MPFTELPDRTLPDVPAPSTVRSREIGLWALGVPVLVRMGGSCADELAETVRVAWERCLAPSTRAEGSADPVVIEALLDSDPGAVDAARRRGALASSDLGTLLEALSPAVTMAAITRMRERLLMLHAAALADPMTGATVLLVGASGAGKTTAAEILGRQLGYLSDETAGLRPDNSVVAYPKPLSVRRDQSAPKEQVAPGALGLLRPPAACHVVGLLLLQRDPHLDGAAVTEDVPILHALVELAVQSSYLAQPAETAAPTGGSGRGRGRRASRPLPRGGGPDPGGAAAPGATMRVRRLPCLDEYVDGDESAVMVGDQVIVLSALATALLALIGEGETETAALAQQLTERYGPPPDDLDRQKVTEAVLGDLERNGLVQLSPEIA